MTVTVGPEKTRGVKGNGPEVHDTLSMEKESHRQQKRDAARKHKERAIYTKKAVRVKEAQCTQSSGKPSSSH